ncbi:MULTISPECIES: hypothetical protein [Pseudomonas]|uniref:Tryptophan 2-monooxygenase oxidoreductase n=1 Tax=Pseudomonas donghuensis TaxID=1163398 RepID=A0AAP0SDM6_9PSED|nr:MULTISPECIES: hypothetical protein [Pseudomonas]KDN98080.1 hypothetical protein BV82_3963 [Pseudomonas donghuensis]MBS7597019.1 hypothetical protein [Pseudomonas sp. RC2C2]MCP6694070.1 hypothetical protein [Pseudomonas donghuensis]
MSVTVIWNWARSAQMPNSETIANLVERSRYYRHPDSVHIAYPTTVDAPLGELPVGRHRIAIVGAGVAGITALYELSRTLTGGAQIEVDLYDNDPDHFLHEQPTNGHERGVRTAGKRAGRVSAARATTGLGGSETERSVYEIGAMRFPEIAGLTWLYASRVFNPTTQVNVFPNPGKVATEFVFADRVDRYGNGQWQDPQSPTRQVFALVLKYFPGVNIENGELTGASLFKIGSRDPAVVAGILAQAAPAAGELDRIERDWATFIQDYDATTLAGAIRTIMEHASAQAELPVIAGLNTTETVNYCVELFGRFGFGTGGFKPLYNISLVEMMRLVLWDYSNEYTLPVKENVQFIERLFQAAQSIGGSQLTVNFRSARVSDVYHSTQTGNRCANVCYYPADTPQPALIEASYDYVVLAMPQDQLSPLVKRAGHNPEVTPRLQVGDRYLGLQPRTVINTQPSLQLSRAYSAPNARMASAISQLHMTRTSKVFGLIHNDESSGPEVPTFNGSPIQAVVSDTGLAASYIVPSTLSGQPYSSFLASYSWDDDSTRLQHDYDQYPQNPDNGSEQQSPHYMFQRMVNRVDHELYDPDTEGYKRWWFGALLNKVEGDGRLVFDWTTNTSAGGFKLDMCGDHYQSNLCFRYHTHAQNSTLDNRFFLACDSYSHLGGWIEGAFMSAINAVAGVVVAANDGSLNSLNVEARKLFTTLAAVA